ncbi:MAG TPA: hypothetical protein VJN95_09520 [Gemmatimonadales bacterium]|nr:hypothetical protein [Gemmatimonadales bacterium]
MVLLGLIILVVLMIPLLSIVLDSPVGRALGRRLEGGEAAPTGVADLVKRVELLEGEVDDLHRSLTAVQEENAFLQRLIEDSPSRGSLPPPKT